MVIALQSGSMLACYVTLKGANGVRG